MALAVPTADIPISSAEWQRFMIMLGSQAGIPAPMHAVDMSGHAADNAPVSSDLYPFLRLISDHYGVSVPGAHVPLSSGGRISSDWYPTLQNIAAQV